MDRRLVSVVQSRWNKFIRENDITLEKLQSSNDTKQNVTNLTSTFSGILEDVDIEFSRKYSGSVRKSIISHHDSSISSYSTCLERFSSSIVSSAPFSSSERSNIDIISKLPSIELGSKEALDYILNDEITVDNELDLIEYLRSDLHMHDGVPYLFDDSYDGESNDIKFTLGESGVKQISQATLPQLVKWLTHAKSPNLQLRFVFLLTYRSFTTPEIVMRLLIHRYFKPVPLNGSVEQLSKLKATTVTPVQIKVFAVIKYWLENFFSDFAEESVLSKLLVYFLRYLTLCTNTDPWALTSAHRLLVALLQYRRNERNLSDSNPLKTNSLKTGRIKSNHMKNPNTTSTISNNNNNNNSNNNAKHNSATASEVPSNTSTGNFSLPRGGMTYTLLKPSRFDQLGGFYFMEPKELAKQLTLLEFELFAKIPNRELLATNWGSKNQHVVPNVFSMVNHFDHLASWSALEIVSRDHVEDRCRILKQFILLATECVALNNYSSAYSMYSGLVSPPIKRLKDTWGGLTSDVTSKWTSLKELFDTNKNNLKLRDQLRSVLPPCIPHIGIYLKDLSTIDQTSKKHRRDDAIVDFTAKMQQAAVISRLKNLQQSSYVFAPCQPIQDVFLEIQDIDKKRINALSKRVRPLLHQ